MPASQPLMPLQPSAPQQLPDVFLPDLTGQKRSLSQWSGRPLLINFWATWCEPCRREIPLLKELRAKHAADKLEVIGIAIDFRDAVAPYANTAGIDYPILIAEQDASALQAFGLRDGIPDTVFADARGHIVAVTRGELSAQRAEQLIGQMLDSR